MGITGLLPFLKKASCSVNIREFSGYTAAVDVYCWLHKSSYACAMDLALGNPTDQYVRYVIKYLELLMSHKVKPILVFDGANLPSKSETEKKRRESKEAYRKKAAEHLLRGDREAAQECFQRSVFVTPQMANDVLVAARKMGVDCIVAPYEADAQLAYLNRAGYADLIITEDSDLLLFGCKQVIFKLDLTGSGVLVAVTAGIGELCCGMRPSQFTEQTLRFMGILSGCDYFPGIPGIGLATAAKILRQTRLTDLRELLTKIGLYVNLNAVAVSLTIEEKKSRKRNTTNGAFDDQLDQTRPADNKLANNTAKGLHSSVIDAAVRAERTFRLQVVFDPCNRTQRRLTDPTSDDINDELRMCWNGPSSEDTENLFSFAGQLLKDRHMAAQLALGNVRFDDGRVLSDFNPDLPNQVRVPLLLQKPRSDGNLFNHMKSNSFGPNSTRPVLGQLGVGDRTNAINALQQPNPRRLQMSIWHKDYPTQKIWVHRTLDAHGNGEKFHCLSVSLVSEEDPTVTNAATINTEEEEVTIVNRPNCRLSGVRPTYGKRMLVAAPICQALESSSKRIKDVRSNPQETHKKSPEVSPEIDSEETNSQILHTYEHVSPEMTPIRFPCGESYLTSTVVSSSAYFACQSDDIQCALQSALDTNPEPSPCMRSPVFHRNPFASPFHPPGLRSPTFTASDPSESGKNQIEDLPTSPTLDGIPAACLLDRSTSDKRASCDSPTTNTTLVEELHSPVNNSLSGYKTPPRHCLTDEFADIVDCSPNFLDAHVYQPSPQLVHDSCDSGSRVQPSESIRQWSFTSNNRSRRSSTIVRARPTSRRGLKNEVKNPGSRSNATLDSFFKQWQFRPGR
ncbi:hypothetical protein D915_007644 [Fasciola hepatica]|uniref:Exonuclease 1 n=1 Tax=Fasciola hepatica TaxID=6192 RepID=A0A4E0R3J4_FASHE|nr:hypothetical protein D915_007644 [Fasciola hepatica]